MKKFSIVTSSPATMVTPAVPTPNETLDLSAIDRLPGLRHKVRTFHVYRRGRQPGKVIREALSKALVHYHPLAGRLSESSQGELQIKCTGEGIWFVESTANCSLDDVSFLDHPLVVSADDLLPNPEQEIDHSNVPVLLKVTEFECGGFVIGLEFCHSVCDGLGAAQFLKLVGEFARGVDSPTITPVWCRESIPSPPKLLPRLYRNSAETNDQLVNVSMPTYKLEKVVIDLPMDKIDQFKTQFLGLTGRRCSTFEVLAANAWQCRARAIAMHDHELEMKLVFVANARPLVQPPLPHGFYGNCFFPVSATVASNVLRHASKVEVVKMIQDAKGKLAEEFGKWAVGEGGDPYLPTLGYTTFLVSEWSRLGFGEVDYGWGPADHLIPLTYSDIIPVCILASPPGKEKGVRLVTQCVEELHVTAFRDQIMESLA